MSNPNRRAVNEKLKGNKLHLLRTKIGRDKIFGDADVLMTEALLFFDWCDSNPWQRNEIVKFRDDYDQTEVPIGRPYSMGGLCVYLGVSESYFRTAKAQLRAKKQRTDAEDDIIETIEMIETIVRTQQIEGASVGAFNPSIVARLNGLAERSDVTSGDKPIVNVVVRDQKTADMLNKLDDIL